MPVRLRKWGTIALVVALLGGTIGGLALQGATRCERGDIAMHEGLVEVCAASAGRNAGTHWEPFHYDGGKVPWVREVAQGHLFACEHKVEGPEHLRWAERCDLVSDASP